MRTWFSSIEQTPLCKISLAFTDDLEEKPQQQEVDVQGNAVAAVAGAEDL